MLIPRLRNFQSAPDALRGFAQKCAHDVVDLWPSTESVRAFLSGDLAARARAHRDAWTFIRSRHTKEDHDSPAVRAAYAAAYAASRISHDPMQAAESASASAIQALADAAGDPDDDKWNKAFDLALKKQASYLQ